ARKDVTFHAGSNSEYWTVAWDEAKKEYVVKVYDSKEDYDAKKEPNEIFHMDDMTNLKATFDIDPTHLEILPPLCDGKDNHKFNTTDTHAKKLTFDKSAEDPNKGDEKKILGEEATSVTKGAIFTTGVYDKNPNPTFKNNFDFEDNWYMSEVSASGTVTINP